MCIVITPQIYAISGFDPWLPFKAQSRTPVLLPQGINRMPLWIPAALQEFVPEIVLPGETQSIESTSSSLLFG